jgi:hypothetical protein
LPRISCADPFVDDRFWHFRASRANQCPVSGGDLNRSTQHLLILLDKEVADGDVTDIVHGEAEGWQPCRRNPETAEFDPELSSGEPPSVSVALVDNVNDPLGQCVAPPGRRTVNTEPLPGSLDTIMSPPIMRVSLRERASPRPVPP